MNKKQEILKRFDEKFVESEVGVSGNMWLIFEKGERTQITKEDIKQLLSDSLDEYRDEVVEMLQDRKKVLEELYSRHKLDIDEHRINEVERTITKVKEEK